ncbi:MipA/OmpV family protein [Roseicella frigidaeris]|nr:MipA/OmpV family protein [Roseicella frigidaeris]
MPTKLRQRVALLSCAMGLLAMARPDPAAAQPSFADIMPNFLGAGGGFAPEYSGSSRLEGGAAPVGRVSLGGERFAAITGPFAELNLIDSPTFQAGPALNYRFGRSGAEDRQVRALGSLDAGVELGGRFTVAYFNTNGIPFRARAGVAVLADASGHYGGAALVPSASLWVPLSREIFVGAGLVTRFASAAHNRYFYGVSAAGAAASGLRAFEPKGGFTTLTAWPAIVWRFRDNWTLGAGMAYMRLSDEVAGSPIVQRGSRDQFIGGVALAYTW